MLHNIYEEIVTIITSRDRQPKPKGNDFDINFRLKQKSWKGGVVDYRSHKDNPRLTNSDCNIVKFPKNQKGKSSEMNLPLMKKRYPKYFRPLIFTFS